MEQKQKASSVSDTIEFLISILEILEFFVQIF